MSDAMPSINVNLRVQKHRDLLRQAGLRPVQIWVPDTRWPNFAEECRRQRGFGVIYGLPRIARKISFVTKRILLPYIRPLIAEEP